jgi:hypothetical protein
MIRLHHDMLDTPGSNKPSNSWTTALCHEKTSLVTNSESAVR